MQLKGSACILSCFCESKCLVENRGPLLKLSQGYCWNWLGCCHPGFACRIFYLRACSGGLPVASSLRPGLLRAAFCLRTVYSMTGYFLETSARVTSSVQGLINKSHLNPLPSNVATFPPLCHLLLIGSESRFLDSEGVLYENSDRFTEHLM